MTGKPCRLFVVLVTFSGAIRAAEENNNVRLAKPTPEQVAWQDMEIEMFLCLDPCTWQDREYDNHSTPLGKINPAKLDTDQWVCVAESMGAGQIVFAAKHTGGFCWWQTKTSDYGVRNTPWHDGKGDVVADLAESCHRRDIELGIYLSPRDDMFGAGGGGRCKDAAAQHRYNEVYQQQLTELLSRYGKIHEVWFDGSLMIDVGDILKKHAPDAMIFQGPHATIRWVGNEAGVAPYPAWNAVSKEAAKSGVATARHGDPNGAVWLPNECDARIRSTWFWNTRNADTLKTVDQLMEMYYRSVGHGAVLLLNHTPDTTGLIPEADVKRGAEFATEVHLRFGKSIAETGGLGRLVELDLGKPTWIDHVTMMEDVRHGERVRRYVVEGLVGSVWQPLCEGTAIGHKKIDRLDPVKVTRVRLWVLEAAAVPRIRKLAVYAAGGKFVPPEPPSKTPIAHFTCDAIGDGRLIDTSGQGLWPFESESAVTAGEWSHVAITRAGDAFTLYHNGKAIARKKAAAPIRHRNTVGMKLGTVFDPAGARLNVFDGLIDEVRVYNRPLSADDVSRLAALKEPADVVEPAAAWQWSPESIGAEWSTVEIDITPFCKEATQYRVEFQKTGGKDDLKIRSVTAVFGGRRVEEYVQRVGTDNTFVVTVPGLGIPLKLEAVVRGKTGRESSGRMLVSRAK